jgi:hypothetical protein
MFRLPSSRTCSWKLTPETLSAAAAGGELRATLTTEEYCSWTASPRSPWIEIVSDETGTGTADIAVRVAPNGGAERSGTVEFSSGVMLAIRQQAVPVVGPPPAPAPGPCVFDVTPLKFDKVVPDASDQFVDVKTTSNCAWTSTSAATWITVSPVAGIGTGRVRLAVQTNTGASRSASVAVAGHTITVNQNAVVPCSYSLSPSSFHVSTAAQTTAINVTTNKPTCSVTAASNASWVHIGTFPAAGGGKIPLTIDKNGTTSKRSATITVSGTNFSQAVKVDQDGR